jgi:hypothetical protein
MRDAHWEQYLYADHSRSELHTLARGLRVFRFCRAYGGHATDADQLLAALHIETEQKLLESFTRLGIVAEYLTPDAPKPIPGQPYAPQTFVTFPPGISTYPHIKQPGHVTLAGVSAYVWVHATRLEISVADHHNPYEVTATAVRSAQLIERLLLPLADMLIDPPLDNKYCICPKYYPGIWAMEA